VGDCNSVWSRFLRLLNYITYELGLGGPAGGKVGPPPAGGVYRLTFSQRLIAIPPALTLVLIFIVNFSFLGNVALPVAGSAHHQPGGYRLTVSQRLLAIRVRPALTLVLIFIVDFSFLGYGALPVAGLTHHRPGGLPSEGLAAIDQSPARLDVGLDIHRGFLLSRECGPAGGRLGPPPAGGVFTTGRSRSD